jgi:hypothetical protein
VLFFRLFFGCWISKNEKREADCVFLEMINPPLLFWNAWKDARVKGLCCAVWGQMCKLRVDYLLPISNVGCICVWDEGRRNTKTKCKVKTGKSALSDIAVNARASFLGSVVGALGFVTRNVWST